MCIRLLTITDHYQSLEERGCPWKQGRCRYANDEMNRLIPLYI